METPASEIPRAYRRTRFVCISDTHSHTVKFPKGDVLIHAGDLTNQGTYSELSKAMAWLEKADFEAKIVIAGNHDITLDRDFYAEHGAQFHNQSPQSPEKCIALMTSSPSISYLCHEAMTVTLRSPAGPRTAFKVFGSPYSPRSHHQGAWAFGYERSHGAESDPQDQEPHPPPTADAVWSAIPLDADVVVTHTPPHLHCDETAHRRASGCEDLRRALWRVRPRLAVCGHVHAGRGAERVRWDIDGRSGSVNVAYAEAGVERWEDPSRGEGRGEKMALVDLTGRGGRRGLENDGLHPEVDVGLDGAHASRPAGGSGGATPGAGTRGLGGDPDASARCDAEALRGRMGRRETCVVNCAVMASSYPHVGGKRFNKPIVVDLDLPVYE